MIVPSNMGVTFGYCCIARDHHNLCEFTEVEKVLLYNNVTVAYHTLCLGLNTQQGGNDKEKEVDLD